MFRSLLSTPVAGLLSRLPLQLSVVEHIGCLLAANRAAAPAVWSSHASHTSMPSAAAAAAPAFASLVRCFMSARPGIEGSRHTVCTHAPTGSWPAGRHSSPGGRRQTDSSSGLNDFGRLAFFQQLRTRRTASHLTPKFVGGKIKSYSSFRRRFKVTGSGKVLYQRPGHVHKRFNKSKRQLFELSGKQALTPAYAKVVRKLGFKLRTV